MNGINKGIDIYPGLAEDDDSEIALGVEVFHRSSLSAWKPDHRGHAFADHENSSVSRTIIDNTETNVSYNSPILCEPLSTCSRDVIYGMVLQTSKQENLTGIVKSFPSIELIDRIIKDYFYFQQQ